MITIVANVQYDFGLREKFEDYNLVHHLSHLGIHLIPAACEQGIKALRETEKVDVLIVDYHSKNCSEDIERLSRQLHPTARLVTTTHKYTWMNDEEREEFKTRYDHVHPGYEGVANWLIGEVLQKFGLSSEETTRTIFWLHQRGR